MFEVAGCQSNCLVLFNGIASVGIASVGCRFLDVSDNELGDSGFKALAELVVSGKCPKMHTLHAASNNAGDEGMVEFAPALYAKSSRMFRTLNLAYNRHAYVSGTLNRF